MLALLLAAMLQASLPPAQQLFDQATAAIDAGKYAEANAILQPLVTRLAGAPKSASLALARLRLGEAQAGLGQIAEAQATLRAVLASGSAIDTPALAGEKAEGLIRLGTIEELLDDRIAAQGHFEAAAKLAPEQRLRANALGNLAKLMMFDDSTTAIAAAQEAVAIIDKESHATKEVRGSYHVMLGRALLNAGRFAEAAKSLDEAVQIYGGLTEKTTVLSAMARGDLAIAYMLQGQGDKARKYLAYTGMGGAGYEGGPFTSPADNQPPPCGEESGIRPDDMAIIEFKIGEDGAVSAVQPIYATRHGPMARIFADAVQNWSWRPADAKAIKPFYREAARVELRCATTSVRPYMLSVLRHDVSSWLAGQGVEGADRDEADAIAYPIEQAELARLESTHGPNSPRLIPVLAQIVSNSVAPYAARAEAAEKAEVIARSANAPGSVVAYFAVSAIGNRFNGKAGRQRERLSALAADAAIAGDPRARAIVGLSRAELQSPRDRIPLLKTVAEDSALDATDPLRVGALTRLATADATIGDLTGAQAAYARTGLNDQVCAVVDARPELKSIKHDESMFPSEALEWGFSGWATLNFDIAADGRTQNIRAVIAYPPLVFGNAAIAATKTAHYTQSYRPGGGLGCSGALKNQGFRIQL
jgi:hypothetical protein